MSGLLTKNPARFAESHIGDEIVVMNLDSGDFFSLTGTAADIWRLIDGTRDRVLLEAQLAESCGVDRAVIADDVGRFLEELRVAGLLDDSA